MSCSTPGLPVHHQFPESIETHGLVMPSKHLTLCRSLLLLPSIFPSIRVFQMSQLFASGGQSIGLSASTSELPVNTQDESPLRWTVWISLQSKGLSKVFSNNTVQKYIHMVLEMQRNQGSNCQHPMDHQKSKRILEKYLFLLYWLCQSLWLCGSQ